jgi:hypothetical protein
LIRVFLLLIFPAFSLSIFAQGESADTLRILPSKDLGLYLGGGWSLARLQGSTYTAGTFEGAPELKNSAGVFAGVCYNFYAGNSSIIRPAVEVMFLPTTIAYQTAINYKTNQKVFPMTLECPLSWVYSSYKTKSFPRPKAKPEFGLSVRPVITVKAFNDLEPVLLRYNINSDVFIGYPFSNDKSVTRVELFYSHGWINLIGEGTGYRTTSIQSLYRSMVGVRCIFH